MGFERDRDLASKFKDLDFVIGGHSHVALRKGYMQGAVMVAQVGESGRFLGRIDVAFDTDTHEIVSRESRLVETPVAGLAPHGPTGDVVRRWENRLPDNLDAPIGHSSARVGIRALKGHVERIWRETYGADFAPQNVGATRAPLPKGDLLERHIWDSMPFSNTLVILELNRDQVLQTIPQATFSEEKGLYTLVTNSYGGGFITKEWDLAEERVRWLDVSWRKPIVEYVKRHGAISPP